MNADMSLILTLSTVATIVWSCIIILIAKA